MGIRTHDDSTSRKSDNTALIYARVARWLIGAVVLALIVIALLQLGRSVRESAAIRSATLVELRQMTANEIGDFRQVSGTPVNAAPDKYAFVQALHSLFVFAPNHPYPLGSFEVETTPGTTSLRMLVGIALQGDQEVVAYLSVGRADDRNYWMSFSSPELLQWARAGGLTGP